MNPGLQQSPWKWPNLLSLLIIVLIAANYFGTFADLDFAWQIRTGERIVETGSLRPVDAFTRIYADVDHLCHPRIPF